MYILLGVQASARYTAKSLLIFVESKSEHIRDKRNNRTDSDEITGDGSIYIAYPELEIEFNKEKETKN